MTRRGENGFTLIEALIALTIMIAMATMLYRSLSSAMRISTVTDQSEMALVIAKSRLAAVGIESPLRAGVQEGREGDYSWRIEIQPYQRDSEPNGAASGEAFWTTVAVSWPDRRSGRLRDLHLTTLKLKRVE